MANIFLIGSGGQPDINFFTVRLAEQSATIFYYLTAKIKPDFSDVIFEWVFTILWPWEQWYKSTADGNLSETDFKKYVSDVAQNTMEVNFVPYQKFCQIKKEEKERKFYQQSKI